MYFSIPGYKAGNSAEAKVQEDPGERFEEAISGYCFLSAETPTDRAIEIETLDGGVGETFIKFSVDSTDSGRGNSKDTVQIIAWGQ